MILAAILELVTVFAFALTGGVAASRAQRDIVGSLSRLPQPASAAARFAIWCSDRLRCSGSVARTTSGRLRRSGCSLPPTASSPAHRLIVCSTCWRARAVRQG